MCVCMLCYVGGGAHTCVHACCLVTACRCSARLPSIGVFCLPVRSHAWLRLMCSCG